MVARYIFLSFFAALLSAACVAQAHPTQQHAEAPLQAPPPESAREMERTASQCKEMTLLSRGVVAEAGRRLLELVVRNSGEGWLSPAISVDLFQQGEAVAQFRSILATLEPGELQRHRIDLSELPPGRYQALSIVQNRDGDISGTREDLEIE